MARNNPSHLRSDAKRRKATAPIVLVFVLDPISRLNHFIRPFVPFRPFPLLNHNRRLATEIAKRAKPSQTEQGSAPTSVVGAVSLVGLARRRILTKAGNRRTVLLFNDWNSSLRLIGRFPLKPSETERNRTESDTSSTYVVLLQVSSLSSNLSTGFHHGRRRYPTESDGKRRKPPSERNRAESNGNRPSLSPNVCPFLSTESRTPFPLAQAARLKIEKSSTINFK
jgi:hypothetical protein